CALDPARAQPRQVVAALRGRALRPDVGRLADVIAVRARGIRKDNARHPGVGDELAEHAFRRRRAADVSGTDEQNAEGLAAHRALQPYRIAGAHYNGCEVT